MLCYANSISNANIVVWLGASEYRTSGLIDSIRFEFIKLYYVVVVSYVGGNDKVKTQSSSESIGKFVVVIDAHICTVHQQELRRLRIYYSQGLERLPFSVAHKLAATFCVLCPISTLALKYMLFERLRILYCKRGCPEWSNIEHVNSVT